MSRFLARSVGRTAVAVLAAVTFGGTPAGAQAQPGTSRICPNPPPPDFASWLGSWDIVNRQRQPTGDDPTWYDTGTATAEVSSVVGGCAVVEYWWGDLSFDQLRGFSVRAFDHDRGMWTAAILWPGPNQPGFGALEGKFRHGRGEFFTSRVDQHGRTTLTRFTFADIRANAMRWDAAASGDSGISWRPSWIMEFTRRPADAAEPRPAWADSVARCDFPELYEFDFAMGEWIGTATVGSNAPQPARLSSRRVVGDCAVEERLVIGEAFESFAIRAFVPSTDGWVAYHVDSGRAVLQHLEGTVRSGDAQLAGTRATGAGEILVTERWRWAGEHELTYDIRESADGGHVWTTRVRAELHRPESDSP